MQSFFCIFLMIFFLLSLTGCTGTQTGDTTPRDTEIAQDTEIISEPYAVSMTVRENVTYLTIEGYEMVLVNKEYHLPPEYGNGITPQALEAYEEMAKASSKEGYPIWIVSGYRSYADQKNVFQGWVDTYGSEEQANKVSARPGESEHQTGLTMDIAGRENEILTTGFGETATFGWLDEHAAEYGFILRFPLGKEALTGYEYEPWHYRYVGTELSKIIMESGLCVEEFVLMIH